MDASEFVARWRKLSPQNEMQVYHDHLDDLCRLANHPTRTDFDQTGQVFVLQKTVTKLGGNRGVADAWFKGHFAIEYKGKGANLDNAFAQLQVYRDNLENPPLLIVSDLDRIIIRTNYTNRVTRVIELNLDSFASGEKIGDTGWNAVEIIRRCFHEPLSLVPDETTAKLTETVATQFQGVAINLRDKWGHSDMEVARFLTKLVFCMFASDVELLPKNIITTIIDNYRSTSATVVAGLRAREAPCAQRTVVLHHTMPPQRPSLSGRSSLLPSRENRIPTRRRGKTAAQPSFDNRQSSIPSATRPFHLHRPTPQPPNMPSPNSKAARQLAAPLGATKSKPRNAASKPRKPLATTPWRACYKRTASKHRRI